MMNAPTKNRGIFCDILEHIKFCMEPIVQEGAHHSKTIVTTLIVLAILLVAGGLYYYWTHTPPNGVPSVPLRENAPASDLGSELYTKAANPLSDTLPETGAVIPNPLEGAYKNPFE